jgi:TonB family protein
MDCTRAEVAVRNFRPCSLALLALTSILAAGHLWGQQFDPRERYEVPDRVRLSENRLWSLLRNHAMPSYPVDAQSKGIQGQVVLMLDIEKDGRVSSVALVSGDSLLAPSAMGAAKRLRFRPYYLDDEAVAIEGQIIYLYTIVPHKGTTVILARSSILKALRSQPQPQ